MSAATDLNGTGGLEALDALLSESLASAREASATAAARERLKRGAGTAAERAEDAARIAEWEARREWDAVANVALFHNFTCACGETRTNVFQGLFAREVHRVLGFSQRWRRVTTADASLENEVAIRECQVPMCTACATGKGWDVDNAYGWEG